MSASLKPEVACPHHGAPRALLALRHIVAIVDPEADAHASLEKAARIALHTGAELELYACDTWAAQAGGGSRAPRYGYFRGLLEQLAQPLRARGLAVRVTADHAATLEAGAGCHVIRTMPDLVLKDIARLDVGSALTQSDWLLVRQLPVPLMLCGPEAWPDQLRFAVCVDPCHPAVRTPALDDEMLATTFMLADALAAQADVLHVLETPPHLPGEPVSKQQKHSQHVAARAVVQSFVAGANPQGLPVRVVFEEGGVADRIVEFVRSQRPHLVTLGVAARPHWAFAAASGTAGRLLGALHCDLLVVKPPGFVSPLLVTD
jgi:universal stress protein E